MGLFGKKSVKKELKSFKKHVKHTLVRDDDILTVEQKSGLNEIITDLNKIDPSSVDKFKPILDKQSNRYSKFVPSKNFKLIREYVEIIVVAITVAFGIRALFIQPFKIPTGSMQPTLFGIHYVDKDVIPNIPQPLNYLLYSTQKAELTTERAGMLQTNYFPQSKRWVIFPWTTLDIGGVNYNLPGKRDNVLEYCLKPIGTKRSLYFPENYKVADGWLSQGDHLFVNRLIYHYTEPKRGDIVVFTTEQLREDTSGKPLSDVGFYYVKRLVGMSGDEMKIENDMLMVKSKGSDEFKPITSFEIEAFNRIYSGKGGYQGYSPVGRLSNGKVVKVPKNQYFMLGDNTNSSSDGRFWGFVPKRNIVGKAYFIFWPISRRWGFADQTPEMDQKTDIESSMAGAYTPQMRLQ